jgi:predicted outer membrane repeat protein
MITASLSNLYGVFMFYLLMFFQILACGGKLTTEESSIDISHEVMDFGTIPLGATAYDTIVIKNDGFQDFAILSASLYEGSRAVWTIEKGEGSDLSRNDELEIVVHFVPAELGETTGQVQIRTTLEDFSNIYVPMSGVGGESIIDSDGDGFTPAEGDCNDSDGNVYPGAPEICDGKDSDCDGDKPIEEADEDFDGWLVCEGDCDDYDNNTRPEATEICDYKDNDCDGIIPDELDEDGDGFSLCDDDCDDLNADMWPGNFEICDELDNDCDGGVDNIDDDNDGYTLCTVGGDCDDRDPNAHPVLLDGSAEFDGDGSVEFPFADIQDAIANVDNVCRSVAILPGTYELQLDWDDGDLFLIGFGNSSSAVELSLGVNEEGEANTGRFFEVSSGARLGLSNLTIQGANANGDGGAIRAVGASVELRSVRVINNYSSSDGGAISVTSGELILEDVLFQGNESGDDGGAVVVSSGHIEADGSTFKNNRGTRGGALLLESSSGEFVDTLIDNNTAVEIGGGVMVIGSEEFVLTRGQVWRNSANLFGGGISFLDHSGSTSLIENTSFQDNLGGTGGGGISFTGTNAAMMVANNTFAGNSANSNHGAGVYVESSMAEDLYIWSNIFLANDGDSALYNQTANDASIAYNSGFLTSSGNPFEIYLTENDGENQQRNPLVVDFTDNGDPTDDDLTLSALSEEINSGPQNGEPSIHFYQFWQDLDGSRNDRGFTGGQEAQ